MSPKVAIVAGAGGALGHATAVTLAAGGLTVVAVDRNERGLGDFPGSVRPEVADGTDPAAAKSLVDRIAGEVGPPDVLVNTIGVFRPGDALAATPETLRLMIDVNLGPALWLSQAVAPHMRQQGSGAIVHVAETGPALVTAPRANRLIDLRGFLIHCPVLASARSWVICAATIMVDGCTGVRSASIWRTQSQALPRCPSVASMVDE
jgi:NAD(P)-dependent dehydrogenase (short-subunit alcohol dehydrogenase family)